MWAERGQILRLHLRHSVALTAVPAMVALVVLHVALRERPWTHEWFWAIYQLGFVTVFLGPLCAGLGAWEGTRLGRIRSLPDSAGERWRPLAARWLAIVVWTGVTYLVSLAVVAAGLLVGGILDRPAPGDLSPPVVAVALCGAWAAIGLALGYRWSVTLIAPVVSVAAFGSTLVAYTTQPYLVKVGGATASLVFLQPRLLIQGAQLLFYAGIVAMSLAGLRTDARAAVGRRYVLVGPVLAAAGLATLVLAPGLEFSDREVPLVCDAREPEVCVARPYRDRIGWPRPHLEPYLVALDDLGVEPPRTFTQSVRRDLGDGSIPDALLLGHPDPIGPFASLGPGGQAFLDAWMRPSCDLWSDPEVARAFDGVEQWLRSIVSDPLDPSDPAVPTVLLRGSTQEQADWLRDQIAILSTCSPQEGGP